MSTFLQTIRSKWTHPAAGPIADKVAPAEPNQRAQAVADQVTAVALPVKVALSSAGSRPCTACSRYRPYFSRRQRGAGDVSSQHADRCRPGRERLCGEQRERACLFLARCFLRSTPGWSATLPRHRPPAGRATRSRRTGPRSLTNAVSWISYFPSISRCTRPRSPWRPGRGRQKRQPGRRPARPSPRRRRWPFPRWQARHDPGLFADEVRDLADHGHHHAPLAA